MLLVLGSNEACTPTLVSLPEYTHMYNNVVSQFGRYTTWLNERNRLMNGFTNY